MKRVRRMWVRNKAKTGQVSFLARDFSPPWWPHPHKRQVVSGKPLILDAHRRHSSQQCVLFRVFGVNLCHASACFPCLGTFMRALIRKHARCGLNFCWTRENDADPVPITFAGQNGQGLAYHVPPQALVQHQVQPHSRCEDARFAMRLVACQTCVGLLMPLPVPFFPRPRGCRRSLGCAVHCQGCKGPSVRRLPQPHPGCTCQIA